MSRFQSIFCALTLAIAAASAVAQEKGLIFYGAQLEELEYRFGDCQQELLA